MSTEGANVNPTTAPRWTALLVLAALGAGCAMGAMPGDPPANDEPDAAVPSCGADGGCVRAASVCVPGRSAAQFQAQAGQPASMMPGERARLEVTFANCSGRAWTAGEGWALEPAPGADGERFGVVRVVLPRTVPDGDEVTVPVDITAPGEQGSYGLAWSIAQPSGFLLQEPSPRAAVDVRAPADCSVAGPPVRSRFDAPPAFVATGGHAHASLVLANCSTTAWTRDAGYHLAGLDGSDAAAFGAARVELPGDVASGDRITVDLDLVAPDQPGAYQLAWRVERDDPSGPAVALEAPTPRLAITALEPADCSAAGAPSRFLRQGPPDTLSPGQTAHATVTFANCSGATWDGAYALVPGPGTDASTWGVGRVPLPLAVGSGYAISVGFDVHAPGTPGNYPYRWSIAQGTTALDEPSPPLEVTVRCVPVCGDHSCGGDGCGGSCGSCSGGATCDGAYCREPLVSCGALQWWNSYITWEHVSGGWNDTDLGVSASTPVQLRHASRLDHYGVYGWGYMPEFTDLVTGARFRLLHLRPAHQWATDIGRVYPAGYIVGLSGGDTYDTGYPTWSTGAHLCVQTLVDYRAAFPSGRDACM